MYDRDDVALVLDTLIEGDDMDFDGLALDDPIWKAIGFDPESELDHREWLDSLSTEEFERVVDALQEEGYM
jgi:hypothetical protein